MLTLVAGLLLGLSAAAEAHHRIASTHRGHAVEATYRPRITVAHRQVGSTAPGGRPATLRCAWTAAVAVERHARRADGIVAVRRIDAVPIAGTRAGWCDRRAPVIAAAAIRARVAQVAARDADALLADLDTAHDRAAG